MVEEAELWCDSGLGLLLFPLTTVCCGASPHIDTLNVTSVKITITFLTPTGFTLSSLLYPGNQLIALLTNHTTVSVVFQTN